MHVFLSCNVLEQKTQSNNRNTQAVVVVQSTEANAALHQSRSSQSLKHVELGS